MVRICISLIAFAIGATPTLALDLARLSKADLARVDRQCDVLRFRQASSLSGDTPEPPGPGETVTDPSGYWADSANGMVETLSKIDLSSLTVPQCREAGFYSN